MLVATDLQRGVTGKLAVLAQGRRGQLAKCRFVGHCKPAEFPEVKLGCDIGYTRGGRVGFFQCAARLRTILTAGEIFSGYDSTTAQQVAATLVTFDHSTPEGEKLTALRAALAPIATAGNVIDATWLGYWGDGVAYCGGRGRTEP